MTRADAQSIEGHAHTVADKYYKRAPVQMGITKRKGATPNRSGEWWYGKPAKGFIGLMMVAITAGYNKRFNTALERHPYYKGAVEGLKKSPK
jgi:predicted alpha-1,6-mannanase (GH76 family)